MADDVDIERIYRQHGHVVLRRARRILGNEVDAQEVLQELFAEIVARPENVTRARSVVAWLYGATTHHCLNRLRNSRNRARILDEVPALAMSEAAPATGEHAAVVTQLLARMPAMLTRVVVYHHLDELTHDEIAELLGCSRRHVGDLIQRARAWVHEQEEDDELRVRTHAS